MDLGRIFQMGKTTTVGASSSKENISLLDAWSDLIAPEENEANKLDMKMKESFGNLSSITADDFKNKSKYKKLKNELDCIFKSFIGFKKILDLRDNQLLENQKLNQSISMSLESNNKCLKIYEAKIKELENEIKTLLKTVEHFLEKK